MLPDQLFDRIGRPQNLMEHGHLVPNLMTLAFRARIMAPILRFFGHTHEPLCEYAYGVMLLNPGSAGNRCRGGAARLLLLDKDKIRVDILFKNPSIFCANARFSFSERTIWRCFQLGFGAAGERLNTLRSIQRFISFQKFKKMSKTY